MGEENINGYIKGRYGDQVNWYDKKAIHYKRLNYLFQIPTIIIGPVVPILALLEYSWSRTLTVVFSAIVAILVGILNYCKFEEKWHNYRTTCEMLKKEKYYYQYKVNEYGEVEDPGNLFIQRVESIISKEHTTWLKTEKSKKKRT